MASEWTIYALLIAFFVGVAVGRALEGRYQREGCTPPRGRG